MVCKYIVKQRLRQQRLGKTFHRDRAGFCRWAIRDLPGARYSSSQFANDWKEPRADDGMDSGMTERQAAPAALAGGMARAISALLIIDMINLFDFDFDFEDGRCLAKEAASIASLKVHVLV